MKIPWDSIEVSYFLDIYTENPLRSLEILGQDTKKLKFLCVTLDALGLDIESCFFYLVNFWPRLF